MSDSKALTREPQRFVCKSGCYSTEIKGFLDVMQPHVDGEWILMTDYEVLRAERDALKVQVETIKEQAATALASQARFAGKQSNEMADLTRQQAERAPVWRERGKG